MNTCKKTRRHDGSKYWSENFHIPTPPPSIESDFPSNLQTHNESRLCTIKLRQNTKTNIISRYLTFIYLYYFIPIPMFISFGRVWPTALPHNFTNIIPTRDIERYHAITIFLYWPTSKILTTCPPPGVIDSVIVTNDKRHAEMSVDCSQN